MHPIDRVLLPLDADETFEATEELREPRRRDPCVSLHAIGAQGLEAKRHAAVVARDLPRAAQEPPIQPPRRYDPPVESDRQPIDSMRPVAIAILDGAIVPALDSPWIRSISVRVQK